mgnify:FL=1
MIGALIGAGLGLASSIAFQFHKGTIKTDLSHNDVFSCAPFQFHKGTIKTG